MSMNYDLTTLTQGERLWLWRRRTPSPTGRVFGPGGPGLSVSEAAPMFLMERNDYANLERDLLESDRIAAESSKKLNVALEGFEAHLGDLCRIARRRFGSSLETVEVALGISRVGYHKLEAEADYRIVAYWRGLGFAFPEPAREMVEAAK
jgi:hypothetical protein